MLTNLPTTSNDEVCVAGTVLIARGVSAVVCTLRSQGCMLITAEESVHCPIPTDQLGEILVVEIQSELAIVLLAV
jgi:fructose-1-phosphate kinase PfkB-like protein